MPRSQTHEARRAEHQESIHSLLDKILSSDAPTKDKGKLMSEVRKARPPLEDRWLYRWVVFFLGVSVVLTVVLGFWLTAYEIDLNDGLIALGSGAAGALAGLLAPSPRE